MCRVACHPTHHERWERPLRRDPSEHWPWALCRSFPGDRRGALSPKPSERCPGSSLSAWFSKRAQRDVTATHLACTLGCTREGGATPSCGPGKGPQERRCCEVTPSSAWRGPLERQMCLRRERGKGTRAPRSCVGYSTDSKDQGEVPQGWEGAWKNPQKHSRNRA